MRVYEEVEKHVLQFGTGCRLASEKDLLLSVEQEAGWAPELDLEDFMTVSRIEKRFIVFPKGNPILAAFTLKGNVENMKYHRST